MHWTVRGADRQTGEDRSVVVEATDHAQAERRGGRAGLVVESAEPENEALLIEPEAAADLDEGDLIIPGFDDPPQSRAAPAPPAAPPLRAPHAAVPLPYSSGRDVAPSYQMLRFWCRAAIAGSWLAVGLAVLFLLIGLLALAGGVFSGSGNGLGLGLTGFASSFLPAAAILISAGPLGVLGYGGLALIDIARNSYRR